MTIAIQGVKGAYHEVAAKGIYGDDIAIDCCKSFKEIFAKVESQKVDCGLVAIENTIAGTLRQNHNLLQSSSVMITGEYRLRISHTLCCLPQDTLQSIQQVHSHPIALMQCELFLEQHPTWNVVEKDDTASSAERIAKEGLSGCAAICSEYAANLYGLKVLQRGIETNKHNFTRFLVIQPRSLSANPTSNKASISFALPHQSGSLSQVLSILSFYGMNLTKIESLPIIGKEWEYQFHIDYTYDDYERYRQSVAAIEPLTTELSILGEYTEHTSICDPLNKTVQPQQQTTR